VTGPPEFRDLYGDDVPAEDRARLERVHELLVGAGPPPELPPSLAEAPDHVAQPPSWLPRRRLGAAFALAAAIALAAFLGGYLAGYTKNDFNSAREVSMVGTSAAPNARALIKLGKPDGGGNWPMVVTVHGLPLLPKRGYYELFLTRNGKPIVRCGSFKVESGAATVDFTVPYWLKTSDGWIVTRQKPGMHEPGEVILKT
jgi:hypothetical protein